MINDKACQEMLAASSVSAYQLEAFKNYLARGYEFDTVSRKARCKRPKKSSTKKRSIDRS